MSSFDINTGIASTELYPRNSNEGFDRRAMTATHAAPTSSATAAVATVFWLNFMGAAGLPA